MNFISYSKILKLFPNESVLIQKQLSEIFDIATNLIVDKIQLLTKKEFNNISLHHLVREEQIYELAKILNFINDKIIENEYKTINLQMFNANEEKRRICSNLEKIDNTANIIFETNWKKLYNERWIPKSEKLLRKNKKKQKKILLKMLKKIIILQSHL